MPSTARRFSPTFNAVIVPETIETRNGANGPYTVMSQAVVVRDGREDLVRTVMAFGKPHAAVSHLLSEGSPITLAVRFDGGSLRVIGLPNTVEAHEDALSAPHAPGTPYVETAILTLYGVLLAHDVEREAAEVAIQSMLDVDGGGDAVEAEHPFDAEVVEARGHVLLPLIGAGVEPGTAVAIATSIDRLPVGEYLQDLATLRMQNVTRAFIA
jgi:hypothetical protein